MQCPYCHGNIPDNSKFCTLCGKKIAEPAPVQNQTYSGNTSFNSQIPSVSNPNSSFTLNDVTSKAGDIGKKLAGNVDFHNLNVTGIITLISLGWLIELFGCFIDLIDVHGFGISLQNLSEALHKYAKVDMGFGWIMFVVIILAGCGFYLALKPENGMPSKASAVFKTIYGIISLVISFILFLILFVLRSGISMAGGYGVSITLMGWLTLIAAAAILILSAMELTRLCTGLNWKGE